MRKLAIRILALLLFSLSLQPLAQAQDDDPATKVGVTVSAVINAKPHVGPRVSAAVGKALAEVLNADVLAGPDAQARLPEEAQSETCLGESTCLVNAGKALGVDQLLMLIIVGVGDELKIEATWVNVASGDTALRPGITTADTNDSLRASFTARAQELLPDVPVRKTNSGADNATKPDRDTSTGPDQSLTQVPDPKPVESDNGVAKLLMIGGGVALAGSLGYGAYQKFSVCSEGNEDCDSDKFSKGTNFAVDVVGVVGAVALSAGLYLYFTGDEKSPEPSPVAFSVGSDLFQLSYGGSF